MSNMCSPGSPYVTPLHMQIAKEEMLVIQDQLVRCRLMRATERMATLVLGSPAGRHGRWAGCAGQGAAGATGNRRAPSAGAVAAAGPCRLPLLPFAQGSA